ncbi:glycosyltransferase family 90 protein [Ilyonectria sp. MPI-CAGE-AT-0026]|nr:glycosyltransferase family 90 protein [Ilyonectria sp. MPI-CAGE-AT-0026]
MLDARTRHDEILSKRITDLETAAAEYRTRRGRHPPPGFDRWFQAALDTNAVVVEDYFDRIYKDLTPYWAIEDYTLKRRSSAWHFVVKVRNGTASAQGNAAGRVPWLQLWTDLVKEFAEHLPDLDMPINYMDESRILVPFDTVAKLVKKEAEQRRMPAVEEVTTQFEGLQKIDEGKTGPYDPKWFGHDQQYWDLAVQACGPDTPAHGVEQLKDYAGPAEFPQNYRPSYAYKGFIQNRTAATDPCLQPHVRQLHGSFMKPISLSTTQELIPLFGGSKLPINNEILIPGAMYLSKSEFYSGGESLGPSWARKKNGLIWRGDGSGGHTWEHSWHHFQRHRLVDMLNGTSVSHAEAEGTRGMTFELPSQEIYPNRRIKDGQLGAGLKTFADTAFVHLCPPNQCAWFGKAFQLSKEIPMKKQYYYKFLPDVDGNSFSARFRGFLRSTSLPLKATVYTEWHDDRIVPWLHFVPLDNTFQDLYPALDFFADGDGPGDVAARFIAERGKEWAETALRREDMRLYVWRLLLEWARVCDPNRHTLGFVDDLKEKK